MPQPKKAQSPGYLPKVASEHLHNLLYGSPGSPRTGLTARLEQLNTDVSPDQAEVAWMQWWIDLVTRLITDPRMKEAYTLLAMEFEGDEDWLLFLQSATAPVHNFSHHRSNLSRAKTLRSRMVKAAKTLLADLEELEEMAGASDGVLSIGINWPHRLFWHDDYFSRSCLAEEELLTKRQNEIFKKAGVSFLDARDISPDLSELDFVALDKPEIELEALSRALFESSQIELQLQKLRARRTNDLAVLAFSLGTWEPRLIDFVAAAADSQKSSSKMEIVRLLGHGAGVTRDGPLRRKLSAKLSKAIAIVANVLTNEPHSDVTPEDVRKALSLGARKQTRKISN